LQLREENNGLIGLQKEAESENGNLIKDKNYLVKRTESEM
jgi:hypothetical protein